MLTLNDLTINICTVDRPAALRAGIQSLLDHTPPGPTLQLILNEASPETWPAIEELVSQWPGPVNRVDIVPRVNVTLSHQRALDEASTKLVNFMGDDDIVFADRFVEAIEMFNSVPDLKQLGTWCHRVGGAFDAPKKLGKMDIGPTSLEEWQEYRKSSTPVQYCFPALIFDTEACRQAGGFQERFGSAMDVALSGYVGRSWPSLTQTTRTFGFRIHDGSDSAKNFRHQFDRYKYFESCLQALDAGQPEPSLEEWEAEMAARPAWERFQYDRMVNSRALFRRAGAAAVDGRKVDAARHAIGSFLSWPPQFFSKLREQRGR